ncbi:RNA-directed DNA polymerase from mobile element jockey [Elysia marginata]|uniref:RNA-directed DNA polymerase from mobile element jockey n=1 Tax=Elysia marginata TaxID=1093978 RepID=A0AAV4H9U9_9GAST|nr:RNA-directed DNA polymerase from mobile element jockey [Elysia marginata]
MMFRNMDYSRLGASTVDPQADEVPGSLPRKSPPQATGGNKNEKNKILTILHWNAECISRKKLALANRLKKEDIDVACIQESHLTPHPKHGSRFTMKGHQTFKQDRQDGPKGGVITLVKNDITASEIKVNAGDRAEVIGTELHFKDKSITTYNCYCPPGKEHALHAMNIGDRCFVVGDFNSHSPSWGYENQDARGEEVQDWQTNMSLLLLNSPEDPRTFYSRSWMPTSTPDLAFATEYIALKTTRQVMDQLGGSDHKPVLLRVEMNTARNATSTLPRWNYKKANWDHFTALTDELALSINARSKNTNRGAKAITEAIIKSAKKAIPRGARKNYRPYWTEGLEELENEINVARKEVEEHPSVVNNVSLKRKTAKLRKETIRTQRQGWQEKQLVIIWKEMVTNYGD